MKMPIILFLLAPWKLWLCPFLFRILKLLFCPIRISLSHALDELAERDVRAGPGI